MDDHVGNEKSEHSDNDDYRNCNRHKQVDRKICMDLKLSMFPF